MDFTTHPGAETPCTGQLLIVIDSTRGRNEGSATRVAALVDLLRESGLDRLPADRRYRHRDASATNGIPVTEAMRALFA